jgi:hypothetical protein
MTLEPLPYNFFLALKGDLLDLAAELRTLFGPGSQLGTVKARASG